MEATGYQMVLEDQPVQYTLNGKVMTSSMALYKDGEGNSYFMGYDGTAYSIRENNKFTYGDKEYYIGTAAGDVDSSDLQLISHDETRDDQMWWIDGTEYHHVGSETGFDCIIGDVNGDKTVDVLDAALIQKYTVDKITLTSEQLYAADVNNDNNVDVLDAVMIQKYSVEKLKEFPKKA